MRSVWPVFGRKIDQIDIKMKAMWGCQKERKNNEFLVSNLWLNTIFIKNSIKPTSICIYYYVVAQLLLSLRKIK